MTTEEQNSRPLEMHHQSPSPGKMLASARMSAGLSQDQVASELYMTVGKVRSLELDDFERLHSDTFIRGYLRAYANLLKVDADQVMAAYDERAKKMGLVTEPQVQPLESSNRKIWQFALLLLSLLLLVWLVSVWFLDNKKDAEFISPKMETELPEAELPASGISDTEVAEPDANIADTAASVESVPNSGGDSNISAEAASSVANQTPAAKTAPETASQILPAPQAERLPGQTLDELRLEFQDECWLEVSDANGDVLVTELERAGASLNLKGQAPFSVKLGNAPGAKIYLNGQPIEVPATRGTNVATLKIGQ